MKKQRWQIRGVNSGIIQASNMGFNRENGRTTQSMKGMSNSTAIVPAPVNNGRITKQRRQGSLCFRCEGKYTSRHQCRRQLPLLEGEEEAEAVEGVMVPAEMEGEESVEISLHALRGLTNSKIIKVEGKA